MRLTRSGALGLILGSTKTGRRQVRAGSARAAPGIRGLALGPHVLVVAVVLFIQPASAQSGAWLDQRLSPWNIPGALLPAAPAPKGDAPSDPRCAGTVRQPQTPQERALVSAGWFLFGRAQASGVRTILLAEASVDGMCRPWDYQAFVFVGLRFAGTLSPTLMDSRTDGALSEVRFTARGQIEAVFLRYAAADPLCCPSRLSIVRYHVELPATLPRVMPGSVRTWPTAGYR
jgi:LppP/LprE lipoprotein